ncbi:MAG: sugar ABC transporter substrate-binding protein [Actinobacteria bacterium]|nr:sugar ABC transporter substrate-binding protein [Actinomycetota bacterium]
MSFASPRRRLRGALAAGVVASAVALVLAGCAPGSATTGPAKGATDVSTQLTSKKVALTIADETGFPLTDELTKEFTKQHPNVTFTITRDTFQNLTANAPKLLASSTPPDLIRLPTLGDTVRDGLVANLDPYFTAYGWDKWPAAQLAPLRMTADGVRGSGSLYQLGLGYSVTGIFVNTKLAQQAGITSIPKTLDELGADFAKAKSAGVAPLVEGDKDGVVNFTVQAAMNQYVDKQQFLDWMFNKPGATYDQPGNVKGAELIRTWADAGYFPSDINAVDYFTFVSNFQDGKGVYTFNGNWEAANYAKRLGKDVQFFLVPPAKAGGDHVAMGAANSFSAAAKSKNLDTVAYFLNWVHTNAKARQIVVDVTGAAPGGDPAEAQPKVEKGSLTEQVLAAAAQIGKENGQVDFMANTTAGIYAGAIIPESQLLVTSKITGKEFVDKVQAFYAQEVKK